MSIELAAALAALGVTGGGGGSGVPSGGSIGQTLVKQSSTNGDAVWSGVGDVVLTPSAGAHAWWRIAYVSGNDANFLSAFDIQFRQIAGVTEHPTGGTILEAHTRSGFLASDAFDASNASRWALDNIANIADAYLGYHYASPIAVAQVRMYVDPGSSETPKAFNIQYSDDGVTWTTALAVTNQTTGWNLEKLYDMPATSSSGLLASLDNLSDVVITSPSNNQFLKYNSSTGKWTNQT